MFYDKNFNLPKELIEASKKVMTQKSQIDEDYQLNEEEEALFEAFEQYLEKNFHVDQLTEEEIDYLLEMFLSEGDMPRPLNPEQIQRIRSQPTSILGNFARPGGFIGGLRTEVGHMLGNVVRRIPGAESVLNLPRTDVPGIRSDVPQQGTTPLPAAAAPKPTSPGANADRRAPAAPTTPAPATPPPVTNTTPTTPTTPAPAAPKPPTEQARKKPEKQISGPEKPIPGSGGGSFTGQPDWARDAFSKG